MGINRARRLAVRWRHFWRGAIALSLMPAGLFALCGIPSFLLGVWGPLRYRELREVEQLLGAIPGASIVSTWGDEDVTFEDIGATIELAGRGRVTLAQLTPASFEVDGDQSLWVEQLGPHRFASCVAVLHGDGRQEARSFGWGVRFGSAGPFSAKLPVRVRSVQDVATHFDALVAALHTWPKFPSYGEIPCPVRDEGGTEGPCADSISKLDDLKDARVVFRYAIAEESAVLGACDSQGVDPLEERDRDAALRSVHDGFRDLPPTETAR